MLSQASTTNGAVAADASTQIAQDIRTAGADAEMLRSGRWAERSFESTIRFAANGKPPRVAHPTLAVAWGGSGRRILTLLKARLIATYGAVPENVALVCFDSDANDPVAYREERSGAVVRLEPGRELHIPGPVPIASIKRAPAKHPDLFAGLGEGILNAIPRSFITNGAAQDRTQGATYFRWHGLAVERIIDDTLRRLIGRSEDLHNEHTQEDSIQIFLVGSMFGGQGSGALLDHALVINDQLDSLSMIGENSNVIGFFVDPSSFHARESKVMRANTAAFALELNGFMRRTLPPNVRYAGRGGVRTKESPFSHVFLFGGWDAAGKAWPNHDEVCAVAAVTLWLLTCTEVGAKEIGASLNERGVLDGVSDEGFGTYLASAGTVSLRFSGREVAGTCAARAALAVLAHALDARSDSSAAAAAPDIETLPAQLLQNADNLPYRTQIAASADLEQAAVESIPDKARKLTDNFFARRLHDDIFKQVHAKAELLRTALLDASADAFAALLAAGNLPAAMAWVAARRAQAAERLDELAGELDACRHAIDQLQAQVDHAHSAMLRLAEGPSILTRFRRNEMLALLARYLDPVSALARLHLDRRVLEESSWLLRELLALLGESERALRSLEMILHQAGERLQAIEDLGTRSKESRTVLDIADRSVLNELYAVRTDDVAAYAVAAAARTGGLQAWRTKTPDELATLLMTYVHAIFAPVAAMTVEEALQMRWNQRSPQQWIERLETLAAPAWNPDRASLAGGGAELATFTTIGVPDARRSIFANCGRTLVSTNNPELITALRTVYGASFDALKPWGQWRRDYDELVTRRRLHVQRAVQRSEERSALILALGMIYGYIECRGAWHYYRPTDKLQEPQKLAQGLDNALAALAALPAVHTEIETKVEAQMAAEGHAASMARLQAWIDGPTAADETAIRLRRLVRAWAHQRFPGMGGSASS